jgi:hypothetical protein
MPWNIRSLYPLLLLSLIFAIVLRFNTSEASSCGQSISHMFPLIELEVGFPMCQNIWGFFSLLLLGEVLVLFWQSSVPTRISSHDLCSSVMCWILIFYRPCFIFPSASLAFKLATKDVGRLCLSGFHVSRKPFPQHSKYSYSTYFLLVFDVYSAMYWLVHNLLNKLPRVGC